MEFDSWYHTGTGRMPYAKSMLSFILFTISNWQSSVMCMEPLIVMCITESQFNSYYCTNFHIIYYSGLWHLHKLCDAAAYKIVINLSCYFIMHSVQPFLLDFILWKALWVKCIDCFWNTVRSMKCYMRAFNLFPGHFMASSSTTLHKWSDKSQY